MKKLLISLPLIACVFTVSPVKAQTPFNQLPDKVQVNFEQRAMDTNIGKKLGWLEATCFYAEQGWVSESQAKLIIEWTVNDKLPASSNEIYEGENNSLVKAFTVKKIKSNQVCTKLFPPNYYD